MKPQQRRRINRFPVDQHFEIKVHPVGNAGMADDAEAVAGLDARLAERDFGRDAAKAPLGGGADAYLPSRRCVVVLLYYVHGEDTW